MTTAQQITHIIAEQAGLAVEYIKPESELVAHLGMDSLDLVECAMQLEAAFDIDIDDDSFVKLVTVQQVIDHIHELTGVQA